MPAKLTVRWHDACFDWHASQHRDQRAKAHQRRPSDRLELEPHRLRPTRRGQSRSLEVRRGAWTAPRASQLPQACPEKPSSPSRQLPSHNSPRWTGEHRPARATTDAGSARRATTPYPSAQNPCDSGVGSDQRDTLRGATEEEACRPGRIESDAKIECGAQSHKDTSRSCNATVIVRVEREIATW